MRKRIGAVLVFRKGTTRDEATDALRQIRQFLDLDDNPPIVREFDPEDGSPRFYIP